MYQLLLYVTFRGCMETTGHIYSFHLTHRKQWLFPYIRVDGLAFKMETQYIFCEIWTALSVSIMAMMRAWPANRGSISDRARIFLFSTVSRPALGPTQSSVQWMALPGGYIGRGMKLTTNPQFFSIRNVYRVQHTWASGDSVFASLQTGQVLFARYKKQWTLRSNSRRVVNYAFYLPCYLSIISLHARRRHS
jgi:hypothetical protein